MCTSCFHLTQLAPAAFIVGRVAMVARKDRKLLDTALTPPEQAAPPADR